MLRTFFTLYTNAFFPFSTSPEKDEKDSSSSLVVQQSNLRSQYAKNIWGQTMETKPYELVNAFWKNWSQSLSLFSSAGKQLEQLTLETLKQQQDALHKLTSGVDELEKNYNNSLLSSITNIQIT